MSSTGCTAQCWLTPLLDRNSCTSPPSWPMPSGMSRIYGAAEASERREVHRVAHTTDPTLDPDRRMASRARGIRSRRGGRRRAGALGGAGGGAWRLRRCCRLPRACRRLDDATGAVRSMCWLRLRRSSWLAHSTTWSVCSRQGGRWARPAQSCRVELLCAWIAFGSTPGSDAPTMLLEAPRRLTPLSPTLASETLLEASRPQTTGFRDASVAPCGDIGGREANRERQEVEVDSPTRSDAPSWAPSQLGSLHGLHMRQARSDGSNGTRLDHAPASTVLDRLWGTGSEPNGTCGSCTGTFR